MIADDRRRSQTIADRKSQIADDRKDSCFHIIADDRERSQSRLCQHFGQRKCQNYRRFTLAGKSHQNHSRPQSPLSFWPAAGIESSGSNHYERTKEITVFWLSGSLRICIYGACLKWLLPELSIPAAGQKDRRLWGRECIKTTWQRLRRKFCSKQIYFFF